MRSPAFLDYSFPALAGLPAPGPERHAPNKPSPPTDRAQRRQARHRPQPGPAQLDLPPTITLTSDAAAPTAGALTVNTVAASGAAPELRQRRGLHDRCAHRLHRRDLRHRHTTLTLEQGTLNGRRLLGLRRTHDPGRHSAAERPRYRCYPLRPHRHDNVATRVSITTGRQGRHQRTGSPRPRARRLQRRRPHHRHTPPSTAPPAPAPSTSRLLHRRPVRILDYSFPPSPASPAPAPAPPHLHPRHPRPSPTAPSRHRPQPGTPQLPPATNFTLPSGLDRAGQAVWH
jgi:hypothetical protein